MEAAHRVRDCVGHSREGRDIVGGSMDGRDCVGHSETL